MTYCRSPGDRRRWEITVKDDETDAAITDPENVWKLLSRWITPEDANLERSAVYTFHSKVAQKWRKGRILIAGDAAHLTPPFMGQGMCTGIRDTANLAWKLTACLDGADDNLLDTYQAERASHARTYVETAMRLGGLINSLDRKAALKMAEDQDAGGAKMRSIAPKLGHSALTTDSAQDPVGRPFGQVDLGQGQRSFDAAIGYNHAIIGPNRPSALPAEIHWLNTQDHPALAATLAKYKAGAIWIRPDRYIGAIAETGESLLDQLTQFSQ
jgi:3-(3-hydroxy-phenyl)propionate hydroxylase